MSPDERDDELFDQRSGPERWLLPYFEDSALWPVLIVVLAHVAAFQAAALFYAVRFGRPVAIVGLAMLLFGSGYVFRWERRVRGRLGALTWAVILTWGASIGFAWMGWHWNLL